MKDSIGKILREEQEQYLEALLPARDPVAAAIEADAAKHNVPIVDPEVGRFLYIAARGIQARRVLEVGTATGYSGLWLARARESWAAAGVADRVETICRPALEVLPTLSGPFDLVFIDALKEEYQQCFDLALPLLRPGALVLVDNVLWKGRVATGEHDEETDAIRDFNAYTMTHPRLTTAILPLGDGVLYAVVE
jgi:predicted O-methyltransferase YrrM